MTTIDKVNSEMLGVLNSTVEAYREKLNSSVHFVDLSFETLYINAERKEKRNLSMAQFRSVYTKFRAAVEKQVPLIYNHIDTVPRTKITKSFLLYPDGGDRPILISPSFQAAQRILSEASKMRGVKNTVLGATKNSAGTLVTNVDLGHIAGEEEGFDTPALKKVVDLHNVAAAGGFQGLAFGLGEVVREFASLPYYDKQFSEVKNILPDVLDKLNAGTKIIEYAVFTTVHTTDRNRAILSSLEKALLKKAEKIAELVIRTEGSNSLLEDIEQGIAGIIKDGSAKLKKHNKRQSKKVSEKPKTAAGQISKIALRPRTTSGQFISLVSIQALLNSGLAQQIQRNMGKGNAKAILNYRTGRFADSAEITRVSRSRDGAIEAFYNYQKNPYATFAPGGAQSLPSTRDPNLLISKSIRQLAATIMTTRLKVIPV